MAVQGVFASDQNIPGARAGDFASSILTTVPTGTAPMLGLTSGMERASASDTVVTWFEENHLTGRINVTNNAGTGVNITVDDSSQLIANLVYLIESTGEYIYVESVAGASAVVTRGFAGTLVSALDGSVTGKPMQRITNAKEEGSGKPTSIANLGFPRYNNLQIFRNGWDVTGTARHVEYRTGDIVAKNKRDAGIEHAEDMERAIVWGKRAIGSLNGKPFRTMDGIQNQIKSNVTAQGVGGDTSWTELDQFLQDVFSRNIKGKPNERIAFCGNTVVAVVNQIARIAGNQTVFEMEAGQTEFGMKITKWITPYGDLTLMMHPLFTESPLWTKDLMVLHPGAMRTRYLRDTHEDTNDTDGSRAGVDADFGVLTTEMTIEYRSEVTGGLYTGIDKAVAG